MTDDINTAPTSSGCLLLIDSRVTDYQDIINAKQTGVQHLVFHVEDIFHVEDMNTEANPFEYIQTRIRELGVSAYTNVGLIQHNMRLPVYSMFGSGSGSFDATIADVETADPTLQTWAGVSGFITHLKNTYGVQNFDMMACALYSDPNWKYIIDTLAAQTGVTIRASTDDTGAAALGGDWFLESHTGVNLKDVYFTEAIEDFRGVLYQGSNYWTMNGSYRRPVKSFAVGGLELWGGTTIGGTNNTNVNLSNTVGVCSNRSNAAALKTDGSVVVWGDPQNGASYDVLSSNVSVPSSSLTSGVVDIVGNEIAYAAIKSDGSVVIWGRTGYGGDNNTSVNLSGIIDVYPTSSHYSFAALKSNGSVVCWGDTTGGGSTTTPVNAASSLTSGVVLIYSNGGSYAALKTNGSIVTWGSTTYGGSTTSPVNVASSLTADVVAVYPTNSSYAALKSNGSLVIWGNSTYGGASPGTSVSSGVIHVFPTSYSAVALKSDSSIVHWGSSTYTGIAPTLTNVVKLCANLYAFAALKSDGSVIVWGNSTSFGSSTSTPVNSASSLTSGVIALYSNYWSFAALKSDGTVVCWGSATNGGTVPSGLTGVVSIRASHGAFAALKTDGSVILWGAGAGMGAGGTNNTSASISSGIVDIFNNDYSYAALKPTSTPSYDLSMSYYTETDRLSILCSSDYRRTANLTANSNKFTLSLTRSLQKFNYTMPTNQALTLIVPDYQTAPYSLTSTITIPASNGGVNSKSFLITSEIGERVNISGVGTYVNYGTYVYKVETNGTYTKTTSLTVNNNSYKLYGGDGFYYSGIALQYRFGAFSIPAKTFGDTPFNLTAPVSDSPGAFTYTSSDTTVATVTTGGTVTIIKAGTTTITATQAASGSFTSDSITALLVVSKVDSTLGALTVPAKAINDVPFTLTAPTSSISSIISPTYTITTTTSTMITPPDIQDISYGTTWIQRGADIDGEAAGDQSGSNVSMSADGRVLAIGAALNAGGGTQRGHVRVYELSGNTWIRRGADIDGEANTDRSCTVSLSANGTVLAVGAYLNDGTVANSDRSHVRVYTWNGTTWTQRGQDIDGEATNDNSGGFDGARSVSLSADGTIVAIGARYNDGTVTNSDRGHVRVYAWNETTWTQRGADIDGEAAGDRSGTNVSISADGSIVAIGARLNDGTSGSDRGQVRVYAWNGTSWVQRGQDIDGEGTGDESTYLQGLSISADGSIVAIGAYLNDGVNGSNSGNVRIYVWNGTSWIQRGADIDGEAATDYSGFSVSLSSNGSIVAIGAYNNTQNGSYSGHVRIYAWNGTSWVKLGQDIDGEAANDYSGYSVSLSSDGSRVAIGAPWNDGTVANSDCGHVRVYDISVNNPITYSSSNSSVADVCGNLLLIKGVNGTSTITASQTGNTVTGRLDVSGTTYTLQYNPFTYSISDTNIATVSTYGTVTLTWAIGTSTITATQPETLNYASRSVTGTLDVSGTVTVLGSLTIPAKMLGDASFNLTAPTTNNTSGAFTYTSSNTAVATVTSGGEVTITGIGTTTITATQALSGLYTSASVSGSLVVNFGNTNTITQLLTDGATVIPTPVSNISTTYGSLWNKLGADIVGKVNGDESGTSISASADGTIVAIGARSNSTNRGTVRAYKYNDVSWNQLGADINGEASSDYSGQSVSLSANGRVLAIGANMNDGSGNLLADSGHVRIYEFNGTNWVQRGGDIDGEANGDQSGISVSLSEDGNIVAIGAIMNDGSGNALSNSGHVRVYKYNATKTSPQLTDQSLATFGPAGWDRLGADIDGEAVNDQSGFSVSISANGTIVAIGANFNDGTSGTVDTSNNRGHVRVYRYNATKTTPQLTNQSLTTFGPAGWDRMGSDIDGEAAADQSGFSVSLSADGTAVAIGSPLYDASGVSNSGRVRVFAWNGTSWTQRGENINGVNINENVGDSVSLSANGNILSVSSFMKVVNYSYNSTTNTWSQIGANIIGDTVSSANIVNALTYSPLIYLDSTNTSSYNGTTWTNLGSLGGSVNMTTMGTYDALDNNGTFNFNGSSNYGRITTPSTSFTNVTFVAVVKLATPATSAWRVILSLGYWNPTLTIYNNNLNFYSSSPSITNATSTNFTFATNTWYFVASTYNTSTGVVTYYVNGVAIGTFNAATGGSWSGTNFTIGADSNNNSYFWNGKISYIALYNRVLTASEIANLSNNYQTYRVSLSSQGNILAIGAREYDGVTRTNTNIGVGRVYRIDTSGNYTFSSNNTTIADVCGNIILPKSIGTTTVGFTQSASGATASRSGTITLNISGTTPTIGSLSLPPTKNLGDASFNITAPMSDSSGAFTYTSSNTAVATVTSDGIVTIVGVGTTTITATQAATTNYTNGSVTASLLVSTITPTYQAISQVTKTYGTDVSFSLTSVMSGVSNSDGAYTFSSTSDAISIVGGVATILAYTPSAITITATQDTSGNYGAGSKTFTLLVNRKVPSYGVFSIPAATYEDVPFSIAEYAPTTDNSGVPFTYTSSEPTVATINSDGTVVTIIGHGYTTITASQAAGGNYAANSITTSFLVNRAAPTFLKTFTITDKTFGDASFSLLPFTEGLDNTDGTYHFTSSNAQLVSISEVDGVTATIHAYTPTPITIYVAIDACGNYAASSTSGTLTVLRARPTFGTFTVPAKNFRDASFNLIAPTSDSSGIFTYSSSNTSVATVTSDGVVTVVNAGSTTITATQEINGNYTTRDISASLVVSPIAPTIGALSAPAKNFGDTSFNLTDPTSDSSGAFTYTSSNTSVATVTSSGTVTIVGVGSTTITATQAASSDNNYTTGRVSASLVVSASLSNFSVPGNKYYGDVSFNLVDPDTTDNTVGFTFASSNTSVATLSGTGGRTVTIVGAGSTVITASQAATANRGQLDISATLVVHPATPVITLAPITKSYGNSSFRLSPSSTNTDTIGGNVFTFSSDNIAVVSFLDASLVRINGIGTATIAITQTASANFTDASSSVVITVNKGVSGFSASTFTVPSNKTFGDVAFGITTVPISSSTGAITYASSDVNVATITSNGSAITLVGQGTVTFTASQAASALYTADTKTSNTLTVARKTAALTRDSPSADTITKSYGDANFTVIATNESNGAFSFTSSDASSATIDISTGEVNIVGLGSTTLTATRSQTAQYNESSVTWTLNIGRGTPTLTGITSMSRNVTVAPFTVTATSASNGTVSYALQDPSSTVLTIHPTTGRVRLKSPGSAVIVASQAQGTLYNAPSDLTATITVIEAGISLQETTVTDSYDLDDLNLNGASLANSTITNTNFSSSNLGNSNFNNSNVTNANMSSADLSGSTMRNATMNGVNFTSANLQRTDLSGSNVRNSIFSSADLSGSILARLDASGASFVNANLRGANLSNANFTNANMTNADIDGADITNVTFTIPQKLQLLKNRNNRLRSEILVSQTTGNNILAVVSNHSAVRDVVNIANATFKVVSPTTTTSESGINIIDIILDTDNYAYFYYTIKDDEYFRIQGVIYRIDTTVTPPIVKNYYTNAVVENATYGIKAIQLLAGSLTIIVNSQNTLSTSSFVVPSIKQDTDAPFLPTTLPTSNSSAPIVYSSSNTNVATINSSTGVITPVAGSSGFVRFTASQVATQTHESASITSNELFVNKLIDFTLAGLNQTFSLSTLAALDASSISVESTDATAVFYVRVSDMMNLFQYQTDSFDVNDVDASDIKYYVFHRSTPTELHLNPSHAMMNKTESAGMIGIGDGYDSSKSLVKHDFIRYIALRLFNTHHGVDLFKNEEELHENLAYLGETVRYNIDNILTGVSTTSDSETMAYDASGNKYLTNDASGNTNLCRELMRQIAASDAARFYNNGGNTTGIRNMPLQENDSINFKLTITAAASQNILTGVSVIPSRTYLIKLMLKNTVNTSSNDTNTAVTDSEMYPNSYPYSTSVVTYAPTVDSSNVYNVYSPPAAAIPTARFGYNGWYYTNSTAWVNVAPQVRDRVKWIVPSNSVGSSTISNLQYIRMNLKVFNKTSLPFLVVYTQAGSYRKYTISAPNSLANGTVYSFFMNFNSYSREPATIGATNAALTYSGVSSGSFADSEIISSIAIESDDTAAAGSVEFTLSRIVVGETGGEKEYGFSGSN